jgi:hypothetical protein
MGELAIGHPLNGRIALILVDNGLELMCHQKCADLLFKDRHQSPRRFTPEQRNDARGRAFEDMHGWHRHLEDVAVDGR